MSTTRTPKSTTSGARKGAGRGGATNPRHTVTIGDVEHVVERPTGRKADQALALLRALSNVLPEVQTHLAAFGRQYADDNAIELTRTEARVRYPGEVIRDALGEPLVNHEGQVRMTPSPVDAITDEDWQASGNVLRLRAQPSDGETIAAVFDLALEHGQDHLLRLLALFIVPNDELKAHRDDPDEVIDERRDLLLDEGYVDEWIELAAVVGEVIEQYVVKKVDTLGERMGNVLRLVGMSPRPNEASPSTATPSDDGPSPSTPASSTDSPAPTDGAPTP